MLRYRLYDIDRVISRTVAYPIITGLLAGVYAGLVLLAMQVLRIHTTGRGRRCHAACGGPVRTRAARVQRTVDRRFNRVLEPVHPSAWV